MVLVVGMGCAAAGIALRWLRARARHGGPLLVVIDLAGTVLLVAAVVLLLAADPRIGGAVLLAILAHAVWRTWTHSPRALARVLRREDRTLAAREPGLSRHERLARVVRARHPRWDPDLVARIVHDQDTPEALARTLVQLEGGVRR